MILRHENTPAPCRRYSRILSFRPHLKRALYATLAGGCLAFASVGHGQRALAQVATPSHESTFAEMDATARFLTQATFGPRPDEVIALTGSSPSQWLLAEFSKDPSLNLPIVASYLEQQGNAACNDQEGSDAEDEDLEDSEEDEEGEEEDEEGEEEDEEGEDTGESGDEACEEQELGIDGVFAPNFAFWINAITGSDQVRQRMAFALSEIMVISNTGGEFLTDTPPAVAYYQDVLTTHALGNYRDLLEAVTYSPAMGYYLTYLANRKGDPVTGRVPDENYARELMQLFTIGLVELNMDGSSKTDINGNAIETYTNDDITGLARVFTGLAAQCNDFDDRSFSCEEDEEEDTEVTNSLISNPDFLPYMEPMKMFESQHSPLEKSFLGATIPAGTNGIESITQALDIIFDHPNVPPFVSRQLIQRFVTSHPSPAYIERVATAFAAGSYTLPDGMVVGDGRRGDLQATLSAILFDDDARDMASLSDDTFGKVREPIIRFANWARAYNVSTVTPEFMPLLWNTGSPNLLGQQPYGAPSVFNFYRPGYVAPGTLTGARD